jgi:ABC-type nickel/cobalt efflux system permease component RcnA
MLRCCLNLQSNQPGENKHSNRFNKADISEKIMPTSASRFAVWRVEQLADLLRCCLHLQKQSAKRNIRLNKADGSLENTHADHMLCGLLKLAADLLCCCLHLHSNQPGQTNTGTCSTRQMVQKIMLTVCCVACSSSRLNEITC